MAAATGLKIAPARGAEDIATARGLFEEYAASLVDRSLLSRLRR